MTEDEKRKAGGAKTTRSETVTVRLNPRSRYLADIAARAQRRTLSSYVEELVEAAVHKVQLPDKGLFRVVDLTDEGLWDVDEMDRLSSLALKFPSLLTHDEQKLWKMIRETFSVLGTEFTGSLQNRLLLRKHASAFATAVEKKFQPTELAEAINGDREAQQNFGHGSVVTEEHYQERKRELTEMINDSKTLKMFKPKMKG